MLHLQDSIKKMVNTIKIEKFTRNIALTFGASRCEPCCKKMTSRILSSANRQRLISQCLSYKRKYLAFPNDGTLEGPNSQNGHSPTRSMLCAQALGTSSDDASYKCNAHKTEEVLPCDFHVSLACLEYPDLFHSCGPDTDAIENYQTSHWTHDFWIVK